MREDRRFVVGKGRFVADIDLPNTKHVALVTCPYPAARIVTIDKSAALAMPGVHYVLDGDELAGATLPLMTGLETPNVPRRPLAFEVARYAGEWVAAVVADTRALAEDAAEKVKVAIRQAALRARRRTGVRARQPRWCTKRTAPTCCSTRPSSGARSTRISPPPRANCRCG